MLRSAPRLPRAAGTLLAACLLLTACAGADNSVDATSAASDDLSGVTLTWAVQADATRSLLEAAGQLKDVPYAIEWAPFTSGPPIVEALAAGRADLGLTGSTPPIFGAVSSSAFRIVATMALRNRTAAAVLVPKGSAITSVQGLKGKRVAVAQGSNAHGLLLTALHRVGLTPKDVKPAFLQPAEQVTALGRGDVDAIATFEPFLSTLKANGARQIAGGAPDEPGYLFELASSKALQDPQHRAAVADAVGRLQKAIAWGNEHPTEFAAAWSKESKIPLAVTSAATPNMGRDLVPVDDSAVQSEQRLADRLREDAIIPKAVDAKSLFDRTVVRP